MLKRAVAQGRDAERQAAWRKRLDKLGPQLAFSTRSAPNCRRTAFSSTKSPSRLRRPPRCSRSTGRARFLSPGYQDNLGWGFATALGAQHAGPTCRWWRSPATAASCSPQRACDRDAPPHSAGPIVFNDGAFGNVRRIQQEHYGNRLIGSDLANPDFVLSPRASAPRRSARKSAEELRRALRAAFARRDGPTLIEVPVGAMPSPWEFIHMGRMRGT